MMSVDENLQCTFDVLKANKKPQQVAVMPQ